MSVSKRLRFLVLRRDGFACAYCGRRSPSVTLEVDHRIPRCQGGTDNPSNLVAACWDCNRGKGPLGADAEPEMDFDDWAEHMADLCIELPDELPRWMLPPRERHHSNFNFDLKKAAAELAIPRTITILTTEGLYELASTFDPASEGC